MTLEEAIKARHSVRNYKHQPLSEEHIGVLQQKNIEAQERAHKEAVARKAAAKAQRQQAQEVKKESVKSAPKSESAKNQKPVETPKEVNAKEDTPAQEASKKRVRQRIRITSSVPVREKVEFFKKK